MRYAVWRWPFTSLSRIQLSRGLRVSIPRGLVRYSQRRHVGSSVGTDTELAWAALLMGGNRRSGGSPQSLPGLLLPCPASSHSPSQFRFFIAG